MNRWKLPCIINTNKNRREEYMSEALNSKTLILILVSSILLTSLNLMPVVNAQPTPTLIEFYVSSTWKGRELELMAFLDDEIENPLQNMDIDFVWTHILENGTVCGPHLLDTATTKPNGVASLSYTFSPGTYNITAIFNGTTDYAPSSSEALFLILIEVNSMLWGTTPLIPSSSGERYVIYVFSMDYTPYIVGGIVLAVVIISVVGYIVYRRRERERAHI
jgi:hypothetical protein